MTTASSSLLDVARRRAKVSGQKIKALRTAKVLTQRDLAELVKIETRTVARWEQDDLDYVTWLGVLNALGLPADWEPPETPPSPKDPA